MSAHFLHLDGIDEGNATWRMTCEHPLGFSAWRYRNQDGSYDLNADPTDCWLMSWWDAVGSELIAINVPIATLPIPIKPDADWDYDNGGAITFDDGGTQ